MEPVRLLTSGPLSSLVLQPVDSGQPGEQRVLDALGHLIAIRIHDRIVGHQMTDVADEQQAASGQGQLPAVRLGVGAVRIEHAGERLAAFGDFLGQVTLVQAQPIAVTEHLVVGVDGGDRVLEVHDRGDRRLQDHVFDTGGVGLADRRLRVDQNLDVQTVVGQ